MSDMVEVVTIDGPSGVGKSTISRMVADRLGYTYLDTGAMYRAVALKCGTKGVECDDPKGVAEILDTLELTLGPAPSVEQDVQVYLNGIDVSGQIRTPEVSMMASAVSALLPVREKLTGMQQEMGAQGRLVAEGRDTGTIVFPNAAWKFYLDASTEERVRRRVGQLRNNGQEAAEEKVLAEMIKRDRNDSERSLAPLKAAPDAIHLDSTSLSPDQVVEAILEVVEQGR